MVAVAALSLIFGDLGSPDGLGVLRGCRELAKPWIHVVEGLTRPSHIAGMSRLPGIGARVEAFLGRLLSRFGGVLGLFVIEIL